MMASATWALPLGLLRLKGFMRWVSYLNLSSKHSVRRGISGAYMTTVALCHWEHVGFKRTSGPTVVMNGIVMTDIFLWVGPSHWFVDVIAMTHDLKLFPAPSGLRAHFTRDMAATGS